MRRPEWTEKIDWQFINGIFGLIISVGAFAGALLHLSPLPAVQRFVSAHIGDVAFQLLSIAIIVIIAGSLFQLRRQMRGLYAAIEIIFGLAAGVYAANQFYGANTEDSRTRAIFAAVAGVYVIVRGLDNWSQRNAV